MSRVLLATVLLAWLSASATSLGIKVDWINNQDSLRFAARLGTPSADDLKKLELAAVEARDSDSLPVGDPPKHLNKSPQITDYMSQCHYEIILKITSYLETSKFDLEYDACNATTDAQGISAGFNQFTTCSGSVEIVCREYQSLKKSTTFCDKYMPTLNDAAGLPFCKKKSGEFTPSGLSSFCKDWTATAREDPLFRQAQINVQFSSYFVPITSLFSEYNLKTPQAMGQLFDISIQLGPEAAKMLAASATISAGGSPASSLPIPEKRWLFALLFQRSRYLTYLDGEYGKTQFRVEAYMSMMNFEVDHADLIVGGETVAVKCE
ncbi:hypothetical protein BDR26DRAFT_8785 [Obelidium mucronatum]|nr:hypothetical protein BDR26DRAFT_8785 [Obelidium mucronatum]